MVLARAVDVGVSCRPEQHGRSRRAAFVGVGGRIARGQIRFRLDDPSARPAADQQGTEQIGGDLSRIPLVEGPPERPNHVSGEICTLIEPVPLSSAVSNARFTSARPNLWVTTGSSLSANSTSSAVVIAKSLIAPSKA